MDPTKTRIAGDFTVETTYNPPLLARLDDGRIVRIEHLGNAAGHSPAYMGWDEQGRPVLESIARFTTLDVARIAPSRAQVERLFGTVNTQVMTESER
jgi:hypothetical protein